jgi:hypothetical protein
MLRQFEVLVSNSLSMRRRWRKVWGFNAADARNHCPLLIGYERTLGPVREVEI